MLLNENLWIILLNISTYTAHLSELVDSVEHRSGVLLTDNGVFHLHIKQIYRMYKDSCVTMQHRSIRNTLRKAMGVIDPLFIVDRVLCCKVLRESIDQFSAAERSISTPGYGMTRKAKKPPG